VSATSGYESFEAPDPAEWTARGYAVEVSLGHLFGRSYNARCLVSPFIHRDGDSPNQYLGDGQQEDVVAMLDRYPMMNEYWEDKRARMDRIKVPAYILASFSTMLHTVGSFRGFEEIDHAEKW
jgi:predicted acyl esterase